VFLQAVIIPPRDVVDAVAHAVAGAMPAPGSGLEPAAAEHLNLPIAALGNVTMGDAIRVAATLKAAAADWSAPTIRFAGATVHEFPRSQAVVLTMDGEVDELISIARAATQTLQRRGFHFDRRKFVPMLSVATIPDTANCTQVRACLDQLEGFRGQAWTVDHVSLAKRSFGTTSREASEFQPILLGAH
jgi:2'-5' RNA ligase